MQQLLGPGAAGSRRQLEDGTKTTGTAREGCAIKVTLRIDGESCNRQSCVGSGRTKFIQYLLGPSSAGYGGQLEDGSGCDGPLAVSNLVTATVFGGAVEIAFASEDQAAVRHTTVRTD